MRVDDCLSVYLFITGILAHCVVLAIMLSDCGLVLFNALKFGKEYCTLSDILHMDTRVIIRDGLQTLLLSMVLFCNAHSLSCG